MLTPVKVIMHESYGEVIMYPHPHHQPKRRKKRPIHGVKTVDVTRGKSGYGFTISGQHPCVLSCIVNNSPAERVGLRPGDYLVSVNGIDVSKLGHDEVVSMVGMSTGTLTIQVAENYNSSDSSDEEYVHRTKTKYPNRLKRGHSRGGYNEKMEKLLADINQRDRYCPDGHTHEPNSRPLPKVNNIAKEEQQLRTKTSRPRLHMPVGAENNELQAEGLSYIEAGASNVFKVPFQKSASASNVKTAPSLPTHHRVEPKHAFIKSTSQGHVQAHHGQSRSSSHLQQASQYRTNMYDNFSPNSLQQIINHSLHSYSAANEAFILNEDEFDDEGDEDELRRDGGEIKIVVGYIGSLEMPGDANQPHVRIQSVRNAVRRLRVEQKIHTLVLMVVSAEVGVRLVNMVGKEIARYPVERLAFSGVCPDDRRFFGIVTLHCRGDPHSSDSDDKEEPVGSSCHVFMVDQELTAHNIHAQKAKNFGIECTLDPNTQRCLEFPRSTTPIILSISNLYKDRPGGTIENDVARSQVFANPNRPVEHVRTSSSSSNNSNSDSGLGLCRDDAGGERAVVVEMPPPPLPARDRQPQLPQIKWSGNTVHLTDGPIRHLTPGNSDRIISHRKTRSDPHDSSKVGDDSAATNDKLNPRAMLNTPPSAKHKLSGDGLEHQNAAENLRLGMQKLIQARQRHSGLDQTSSDTESRSSRGDSQSSFKERPVSAPFKYLSSDTSSDLRSSKSDLSHMKHDSDSSLADKLSPRAFLSSAFTPVGSVGSAFKKVKSRPLIHQHRSPSAPPLPSYHGDDEDSDEDAVNGIIKRMQKDKSLGISDAKKEKNITYTPANKRDQERKGTTNGGVTPDVISTKSSVSSSMDKWSSKGSSSLRQKSNRRNPLSLSHESLVVIDQDPSQQKLASANSVNSIVNHVAKTLEQEQVGRVASWAVSFDKLLNDTIGISVFTDFLKKEFSEENIVFWRACENFRNIVDSNYRKSKAKEIYDTYVSARAPDAVNIDSVARKHVEGELEDPTPQTFDIAQTQIFQLMKQDSYARFLKSDLYKSWLMKEMEGEPIELTPSDEPADKNKLLDRAQEKEGKKKGKGKENEENKDKRRRSLLPWRQKSKKTSKLDSEPKNSKSSKDKEKEPETNGVVKSTPTTASTGTTTSTTTEAVPSRKEAVQIVEVPETIDEEPEQPKFCRVIMPDGSTTVVGTKQGQTINYVLGKLCEKRGLSIASVDVFLLGSEKPLNLNEDISTLGSKEVTIERRVLFRMDLPNKKCIGVKAKPNRLIRDVFKPILSKYGYRIDAIDVHLNGETELLGLDSLVSSIDGQRVIVLTQVTDNPDLPEAVGKVKKEDVRHSLDSCAPERTGQSAAGEVSARDTGKMGRSRQKVTFALQKNTVRNRPNEVDDPETLYARLKRAQDFTLDDQRGLVPPDLELPDFLQDSSGRTLLPPGGRESAPASLNRVGERCKSPVDRMSDYSKEMENYLEDINENFAAYTRESTPNKQLNTRNPLFGGDARYISMFSTFVSPSGKLKATDKSFSEDGVIPSHEEADNLFQVSAPDNVDFDDPHLTDKSLTDIGFSYGYNKYLSKSRNFVDINQRQKGSHKKPLHGDPVLVSAEGFSPNQTVQNDSRDHSDLLESTLLHSPLSSPYESDSSTDKENLSKYVPKSGVRNVQRASRHTLLHSPINTGGGDSFLSTVDTDGKLTRHSTPNVTPVKALSQSSQVKDVDLTVRKSHTEEVTFV